MKIKKLLPLVFGALLSAQQAYALPTVTDLTTDDYITFGGLDWAWASPVDDQGDTWFTGFKLEAPEFHEGWRFATELEWLTHPTASDFGNRCASQYWNNTYTHCDFGDSLTRISINDGSPQDILYVRSIVQDIPEPATLALFGIALAGFGFSRRKKA